jgi:release factor glutamine methyltransferase
MTAIQQWLASVRDVPRIECEVLLGEVLALSRAQILARPERELATAEQMNLERNIKALRAGTPLAYILGNREFWGLSFKVTPAVLIPRPETELLVELALQKAPHGGRVLDLGTGSGAIAVAIASERADLCVTAVDVSATALAVAEENACTHNVTINFVVSDWFSNLTGHWDIVVVNPPYVAEQDPHLPDLQAEPQLALVAADNGLRELRRIVNDSSGYLHTGGCLIVEHGFDQAVVVREEMAAASLSNVSSLLDLAGIERATMGHITAS